jgi:hypothetical protein
MYAQNLRSPNIVYDIELRGSGPGLSRIFRDNLEKLFSGPATGQRAIRTYYSVPHKSFFVKHFLKIILMNHQGTKTQGVRGIREPQITQISQIISIFAFGNLNRHERQGRQDFLASDGRR